MVRQSIAIIALELSGMRLSSRWIILHFALLLAALATPFIQPVAAQSVAQGRRLALTHCVQCHSVETTGTSPNPRAPPFRVIGRKYKVEDLDEAFAEGIVTGHPDMPEFTLEPPHIEALLSYIKSVSRRARR
ncbi:MAG: c-type cytochrome [Beijerinckiaceae bacterium]